MKYDSSNKPLLPLCKGGATKQDEKEDKDICKRCDYRKTSLCDYEKGFDCRVLRGD